jgi:amino acid adenylation domain-containing protein
VAVVFENQSLTYRELNRRANQLAHYLQKLGVGPDVLVGICIERSLEMVIGLLGILKAGGAYVPLDPKYPRERLAYIMDDTQAPVLITLSTLNLGLRTDGRQVVYLDKGWDEIWKEGGENVEIGLQIENLAYVIYTSGSTGKPKGVVIEHRSAVNLVNWATHTFGYEELKGVLASTSLCFDLSVFELFTPLAQGGTILLVNNLLSLLSESLGWPVTLINTVPSAMTELLRMKGLPDSVGTINLAGEPLGNDLVKQIYEQSKVKRIFNLYGPTETTTYSSAAEIVLTATQIPPIGKPIANTQIYLLDAQLQPVPIGVSGELYIGGDGLARGYLHQPELTQERFIPNPFSAIPGARLYKTGDLGRYLPDGNILFLGRSDHQVKIRGFRVEIGEIEAILCQHLGIRQAVVIARGDTPGDKQLVAYMVPVKQPTPSIKELREFLKDSLPEYMMPSAFVWLEAIPLTPNGKIDRKALPAPEGSRPELERRFEAARTPIEVALVELWSDMLHVEKIGIHDNFFELGGHSLLAARIMFYILEYFDIKLSLRTLFDCPTIFEMAQRIEEKIIEEIDALPEEDA